MIFKSASNPLRFRPWEESLVMGYDHWTSATVLKVVVVIKVAAMDSDVQVQTSSLVTNSWSTVQSWRQRWRRYT